MYSKIVLVAIFVSCLGFISCNKFEALAFPHLEQAKLNPKTKDKALKVAGSAQRLDVETWKLSLTIDGLDTASVKEIAIIEEEFYPTFSAGETGCNITWEVPMKRWKYSKPFNMLVVPNATSMGALAITVKHPTAEY
ncbi:MAG: hypothetical protein FWG02_02505 [Holophagaceae bacterium]|nr:hypothetical protein [Holophagaceae bacterium]